MSTNQSDPTTSNGIIHSPYNFSDKELVSTTTRASAHYTSLKDILPPTPSPPAGISPTHNSSWHEIPIRNPLVKHAAWAYLQPMSAPPDSHDHCILSKLKSVCCEIGCFEYFKKSILSVFLNRRDSDDDEEEDDDDGFCCGGGCKVD